MATLFLLLFRTFLLLLRARMFTSSDLKTVRVVLSRCYLGDWWVLYQLGRNSNTHFFRSVFLKYVMVTLHFVPLHFVPGNFVPVTLSPGHFVPSPFVPGHFVPWSLCPPVSLLPGHFVPWSFCPSVTLSPVILSPFTLSPIFNFWNDIICRSIYFKAISERFRLV
jgi:hypothetical protein